MSYSNTGSGLTATNVQDAIDEVYGDIPTVPSAYASNPEMDGTASPGSSGSWARGDHVHPTDTSRVPVYGMGENLFRNAYFVGGGTGRGVFPVNQRGKTTYSGTGGFWGFDGWYIQSAQSTGTVALQSNGIVMSHAGSTGYTRITQSFEQNLIGKKVIISGIVDGTLVTNTLTIGSQASGKAFGRLNLYSTANSIIVNCPASTENVVVSALKAEFGPEQTLAHLEGSSWVLNEIPDYEEELVKCQISTADSSDTYANKSLATEQMLAQTQIGNTANRAYAVGDYFCWSGLLYRATAAISNGEPLTVNSNCVKTTVMEEIVRLTT